MLAVRCSSRPSDSIGTDMMPSIFLAIWNRFTLECMSGRLDDEFIAADARDRVALAQALRQALRDDLQDIVADLVAQRIIDVLEIVEIDRGDGQQIVVAFRRGQRLLDPVQQQQAVGQVGQRVVGGRCGAGSVRCVVAARTGSG